MPRQKREPKRDVVIPSNSLVASSQRWPGKAPRIYVPKQNWQVECYRHYAICGEARFAARFFGHAVSRALLKAALMEETGPTAQTSGAGVDALNALFNGKHGQTQMLDAIGTHLTIAGDCYLVGRHVNGGDIWEVISVLEMQVTGTNWTIKYGDGMPDVQLTERDVVIRIWLPHPARRIEADSPFRALLPILSEIEWLTRHVYAQVTSRLAGAGILMLPQGMTFPPPPPVEGKEVETTNEADAFMLTLADAMMTPIEDPSSPSAMIPIVVTAPDESIDKAKLLTFWSELDANSLALRSEAIRRFALGMDLPPEQVLGMGSNPGTGGGNSNGVSHWGAWQIEEATIKMHVEPMLDSIVNALTMDYLRPSLDEDSGEVWIIIHDTSTLRLRPDRSKEALELWDRGILSTEALIRETGFEPEDMASEKEFQRWILVKIASGSATPDQVGAALTALGVSLPIPPPTPGQGDTREARPAPSLEDHPTEERTPERDAAALLAASDALTFRALERVGNRIRQKMGVKPPNVPAFEVHTLYACNGDAEEFLADAWSCAPQVLNGLADVDSTIQTLNSYCRALLAEQAPHSRARLAEWLSKTEVAA